MTTNGRTHYYINKRGFTLTEAMMAVVVLGIAAASLLVPFVSGAVVRAEGINRTLAARLASDLMEQIVNTPFDQIVGSYNGYSEPQGQVKDVAGDVFADPSYARFSSEVICQDVYVPQASGPESPKYIRVTVQVKYDGRQMATIYRLVSK
jgi:prepilin-type N-terminal cleavage/methylation domain-containing protein